MRCLLKNALHQALPVLQPLLLLLPAVVLQILQLQHADGLQLLHHPLLYSGT
jgi:hypothetical protein